jgi:hypothetical protein
MKPMASSWLWVFVESASIMAISKLPLPLSGKVNREFEARVSKWLAVEWSKSCNPGESPTSVPVQFKPTN